MREALAASDHDFVLVDRDRPRQGRGKGRNKGPLGFFRRLTNGVQRTARYTSVLAGALLAAVVTGIVINAVALQKARHPAPLFSRSVSLPADPPAAIEAPPAPASRPAAVAPAPTPAAPSASSTAPQTIEKLLAAPPQRVTPDGDRGDAKGDAIGRLLKSGAEPTPHKEARKEKEPAAKETSKDSAKTIAGVQRALVKLGFVLKPDGRYDAATKRAVEMFERDHGLAARGELTPKLVREIAARAGVAIE